ncbi:hypothetical protein ACO0QE_001777 [Hanseniaspora vineae]
MSTFTAVNLEHDDDFQEQEEHTRELQVEQGYGLYNVGLSLYKDKKLQEAIEKFDQLLAIEILKPNRFGNFSYNSPAVDRLRYLAYRNRGFLYVDYLHQNFDSLDNHTIVDDLLKAIELLLEALSHGHADYKCTNLLLTLLKAFNSKKLQRWILELELTKDELILSSSTLLPQWRKLISSEQQIVTELKDSEHTSTFLKSLFSLNNDQQLTNTEASPLMLKIHKMKQEDENLFRELDFDEVILEEKTWEHLAQRLDSLLPVHKSVFSYSRISDPYTDLDDPIESVLLKFSSLTEKKVLPSTSQDDLVSKSLPESQINSKKEFESLSFFAQQKMKDSQNDESSHSKRLAEERPQRVSKRVRDKTAETETDTKHSDIQQLFLKELDMLLSVVGFSFASAEEMESIKFLQDASTSSLVISDMYDCISSWSNKYTEILKASEASESEDSQGLTDFVNILKASLNLGGDTMSAKPLWDENLENFIESVNSRKMHFHQVRLQLFFTLACINDKDECFITDRLWSGDLFKTIEYSVLTLEQRILHILNVSKPYDVSIAVSVYEVLVNFFCKLSKDLTLRKLQNQRISDVENHMSKIMSRINEWRMLFFRKVDRDQSTRKIFSRYDWASLFLTQSIYVADQDSFLAELQKFKKSLSQDDVVANCNYSEIPSISKTDIDNLILKYEIIYGFQSKDIIQEHKQVESLIKVLSNEKESYTPQEVTLQKFLSGCPLQVKLQIWSVIFNHLSKVDDSNLMEKCFFTMLEYIDVFFNSSSYNTMERFQRHRLFLSVVGHLTKLTKVYVDSICISDQLVPKKFSSKMDLLLRYFRLFYSIINYEILCTKDSQLQSFFKKAASSSQKFKVLLSYWSILITVHYQQLLEKKTKWEQYVERFLNNFHALFAFFKFCNVADNAFLKFSENVLCSFDSSTVLPQIQQILYCRYHLQLSSAERSEVELHDTKKTDIDEQSAIQIGSYLIRNQYGTSNPMLFSGTKYSMKQIFDVIVDAIGTPDYESSFLAKRNECYFEEFLDSPIQIASFKSAMSGSLDLALVDTESPYEKIIKSRIVFVAAIQQFNIFKTRKKSNLARLSELDITRSLLKADIVYNSRRFESWYLLGKCYSYMAEDDMTWTSDKLIALDKKKITASYQRKAIVCHLMAINTFNKTYKADPNIKNEDETVLEAIFESLGEILMMAWFQPMKGLCFHQDLDHVLCMDSNGELYQTGATSVLTISEHNVKHLMLCCFDIANLHVAKDQVMDSSSKWLVPFYKAKVSYKAGRRFNDYKFSALAACFASTSEKSSKASFIMEPHYFIVSQCYKLVRSGVLSVSEALTFLKQDNDIFELEESFWACDTITMTTFNEKLVEMLETLIALDKKKWYHRPKYRIATIYAYSLANTEKAIEIMEELVCAASPNKSLVTIWKPDHELPGKHFVYITQYIKFYLELLFEKKDLAKIGQVSKKLRKFGSNMLKSNEIQDYATKMYAELVKMFYRFDEKEIVESFLPQISNTVFTRISKKVLETSPSLNSNEEALNVLFETNDQRKASYTQYDDLCIALYFKFLFLPSVENDQEYISIKETVDLDSFVKGKNVQNQSKKRVSKKEVLEQVSQICKKIKSK